jgi:hypothetical protein
MFVLVVNLITLLKTGLSFEVNVLSWVLIGLFSTLSNKTIGPRKALDLENHDGR